MSTQLLVILLVLGIALCLLVMAVFGLSAAMLSSDISASERRDDDANDNDEQD